MKTYLVTGGAGFIGSNFVNRYSERLSDTQFIVLDSLTYAGNLENLKPSLERGVEFIKGDIRDKSLIKDIFGKIKLNGLLNFAAESHVDRSISGPDIFLETNVMGTLNLLNASLEYWKNNPEFRYLQVSTDEVYGSLNMNDLAFTEENQINPSSPYSASKASADHFVQAYFTTYGLPAIITRCSNNYGPLQNREKLIPLMITRSAADEFLPVYGKGLNVRDWIHVDDHNDGIWAAFTKGLPGEVYNLGGGTEKSNIEIVKLILKLLRKPESLITFVEDRLGHDFRYAINYSKALSNLNWKPVIPFEIGIERTVQHYLSISKSAH